MLYEVMKSIKNFFPDSKNQKSGHFVINNNVVEPFVSLYDGQYFLIEGSALNDGVYIKGATLKNEEFDGIITALKIPNDFLSLVSEIDEFVTNEKPSNLQSESFGGYSYTKATNKAGQLAGWREAFGTRLNAYRKV